MGIRRATSQRNYRRQMPITMGQIGGANPTSNAAATHRQELTRQLRETMKPAAYGDAVEHFYLTLHCPALSRTFDPHLKVGAYNSKNKAFYCDLFLPPILANCHHESNASTSLTTYWRQLPLWRAN